MTDAQSNFATALAEFGCGSDEDSLILGERADVTAASRKAAVVAATGSVLDSHSPSMRTASY
jgi:hypothetical protein